MILRLEEIAKHSYVKVEMHVLGHDLSLSDDIMARDLLDSKDCLLDNNVRY